MLTNIYSKSPACLSSRAYHTFMYEEVAILHFRSLTHVKTTTNQYVSFNHLLRNQVVEVSDHLLKHSSYNKSSPEQPNNKNGILRIKGSCRCTSYYRSDFRVSPPTLAHVTLIHFGRKTARNYMITSTMEYHDVLELTSLKLI